MVRMACSESMLERSREKAHWLLWHPEQVNHATGRGDDWDWDRMMMSAVCMPQHRPGVSKTQPCEGGQGLTSSRRFRTGGAEVPES